MQQQLERGQAKVRNLEAALHQAQRDGAQDLAAARCDWDSLRQEEAQELRVSNACMLQTSDPMTVDCLKLLIYTLTLNPALMVMYVLLCCDHMGLSFLCISSSMVHRRLLC